MQQAIIPGPEYSQVQGWGLRLQAGESQGQHRAGPRGHGGAYQAHGDVGRGRGLRGLWGVIHGGEAVVLGQGWGEAEGQEQEGMEGDQHLLDGITWNKE